MLTEYNTTVFPDFCLYCGDSTNIMSQLNCQFDMIFADPPYFLSTGNGRVNINGKYIKFDKGEWDKVRSSDEKDKFNFSWLAECKKCLKDNGTIWVSGTYHNIFSVANCMDTLGYNILNLIVWHKTDPPRSLTNKRFDFSAEYIIWASKNKTANHYFNKDLYTEIGTLSFKEEYINLLSPYFIEGDELSEDGKNELYLFKENCFLNIYSEVIKDIIKNDLYGKNPNVTLSYNELSNKISEFDTYYRNLATINTYITFIISVGILYFLIPLLNKKGRTFSEIILKVERVNKPSLNYLNKRFVVVQGLFNMMNGLSILFLIPIISFGFSELFLLNLLFSVSFVSLIFVLIELIIMCFSKYVQSLKELATSSICCDTSTIDNYYKEKGYDI